MTNAYRTLTEGQSVLTVNRSKFLGFARGIENEDDALGMLAELKKTYADATHICYAYIADSHRNQTRFSDAGEPGGTAGLPILNALGGYGKVCAAVVRYFGGVKLGTGGLSRAYADAAKAAVSAAKTVEKVLCEIYTATLPYSDYRKAEKLLKSPYIKILKTEFADTVCFTAAVQRQSGIDLAQELRRVSSALLKVERTAQDYAAFEPLN